MFSLQSLSTIINIAHIVQIKLESYFLGWFKKDVLIDIGVFLKQAYNLSLLIIHNKSYKDKLPRTIDDIISIIPRQLKHLQIPIYNLNQIKMILEQCENLSTIKCDVDSKGSEELMQWFNENTTNSTCWQDNRTICVWLGRRKVQSTDFRTGNKRIKMTSN
jgi:hypothetical protein